MAINAGVEGEIKYLSNQLSAFKRISRWRIVHDNRIDGEMLRKVFFKGLHGSRF